MQAISSAWSCHVVKHKPRDRRRKNPCVFACRADGQTEFNALPRGLLTKLAYSYLIVEQPKNQPDACRVANRHTKRSLVARVNGDSSDLTDERSVETGPRTSGKLTFRTPNWTKEKAAYFKPLYLSSRR